MAICLTWKKYLKKNHSGGVNADAPKRNANPFVWVYEFKKVEVEQ